MKLSAPLFKLKREARLLARETGCPLHVALDRLARAEGFGSWSLLAAHHEARAPARKVLDRLVPGDLVLLGARPGLGKTRMGLGLVVEAIRTGERGVFFTLEYTERDVLEGLRAIGAEPERLRDAMGLDTSDQINAGYIIRQMREAPRGTVIVIDYLQLLDQRRETPELSVQVADLKAFAEARGLIIVLISQIDRAFETSGKALPDLADVRLPNTLDLGLFTKTCFLGNGEIQLATVGL
ncbi:MAG: DNA helicase [Alphaproteobacteria bacterium]|nr:DNA helicase [Alphaproteobacteria bacterium]